jgi:hypothetical protein
MNEVTRYEALILRNSCQSEDFISSRSYRQFLSSDCQWVIVCLMFFIVFFIIHILVIILSISCSIMVMFSSVIPYYSLMIMFFCIFNIVSYDKGP